MGRTYDKQAQLDLEVTLLARFKRLLVSLIWVNDMYTDAERDRARRARQVSDTTPPIKFGPRVRGPFATFGPSRTRLLGNDRQPR